MERVNTKKTGAELVGSWTVAIGDQDEASMCIFCTGNLTCIAKLNLLKLRNGSTA